MGSANDVLRPLEFLDRIKRRTVFSTMLQYCDARRLPYGLCGRLLVRDISQVEAEGDSRVHEVFHQFIEDGLIKSPAELGFRLNSNFTHPDSDPCANDGAG